MATEAIAEILESDVAAEKVLGRHLRRLGRRINNEQRATLARRVLGVSVLRKRLAYIADVIAGPGDRAADLLALYILYHEDRREEELHTEVRSFLSGDRFDALAGLDLEAQVWPLLREKAVGMHALATEASLPVWLLQRWASQGVCHLVRNSRTETRVDTRTRVSDAERCCVKSMHKRRHLSAHPDVHQLEWTLTSGARCGQA